jgi:YVTN family beta-propeller protein
MVIDEKGHRLFVAELEAGAVEAVDTLTGRSVARHGGLLEPQGVAYLPALDELAVASGGDGTVRFLKARNLSEVGVVALGRDADDVRVDGAGRVVAGYGAGGLAVIDPATLKVVARVELGAHPEGFSLDNVTGRVFVNLPSKRTVVVADLASGKPLSTWGLGFRLANYPMALDGHGKLDAVVFRLPPSLVLFRASNGVELAATATCGDADDVFFDDRRQRLYVSCGSGQVEVYRVVGESIASVGAVPTRRGARTSIFSPALDRLFVAAPAALGHDAVILVYRLTP